VWSRAVALVALAAEPLAMAWETALAAARAKARVVVRMSERVGDALMLALVAPGQEELLEWSRALWASVASVRWLAALMSPRTWLPTR
jgi:hypothetical protein